MKLQKQLSKKYKGKEYAKWVLVLSPDSVEKLGWKEGQELFEEITNSSLMLKPSKQKSKSKENIPIYENFRKSVQSLLTRYPAGLTWTEIKHKMNLPQDRPYNKWVKQLEKDIGLKRLKQGNRVIWKIEHGTVFTIGYEGIPILEFVDILVEHGIEQLVDVREIAYSRKNGFSKGKLTSYLKEAGIRYKHLSSLGSPQGIRNELRDNWDYKKFFAEYKKHLMDVDVLDDLKELEGLSIKWKTALMCFEKDHSKCHRSIITEELKKRGWDIENLGK